MTNKEKLREYLRQYDTCHTPRKKEELKRAMKRIKRKIELEERQALFLLKELGD